MIKCFNEQNKLNVDWPTKVIPFLYFIFILLACKFIRQTLYTRTCFYVMTNNYKTQPLTDGNDILNFT